MLKEKPEKCPKCGSKEFKEIVKDRIDFTVCEYALNCTKCDKYINYYSYGNWEVHYDENDKRIDPEWEE